jgi:hypothetical protein
LIFRWEEVEEEVVVEEEVEVVKEEVVVVDGEALREPQEMMKWEECDESDNVPDAEFDDWCLRWC